MNLFLTGWRVVLHGGPRGNAKAAVEFPTPRLRTPEGEYERVARDDKRRTALYRWVSERRECSG